MTSPTDIPALPRISAAMLKLHEPVHVEHPQPLTSLVASARRLTSDDLRRGKQHSKGASADAWQEDAWDMFDLVGEQHYLITTLAGRLSQARFYVGRRPQTETDDPEPTDDEALAGVLNAFGKTSAGRSMLVNRMAINLSVVGDGWFVGLPPLLLPESERPDNPAGGTTLEDIDAEDIEWRMLSVSEVVFTGDERTVELAFGPDTSDKVKVSPEDVYMIRVWRPHPRYWWQADSPVRASLPVLKELVGLTLKIAAQVDSRLAGAGLLVVPQSAKSALMNSLGLPPDSDADPFTEALIEAMMTPIQDRSSAAAVVPLVVTVPDEAADKFQYMTFDKPLDTEDRPLREEAIRRLALGQDAPPEVLLGTAGMNHWGGWLVREDVVATHLEPTLALICDALTTQYLWPVLESLGYEDYQDYVIWYDVSHLVTRPNHGQDALTLHERGVISDGSVRFATGFDEIDAPYGDDLEEAHRIALGMVTEDPSLMVSPGLRFLIEHLRAALNGDLPPEPPASATPPTPTTDTSDDTPESTPGQLPSNPTEPDLGPTP